MAVELDGESLVTNSGSGATSITISGKTTAGSNRYGVVCIGGLRFSPPAVTAATWNGVAMTNIADVDDPTNNMFASIWGIVNPPTGSSSIVVSTPNLVFAFAGAQGFKGVNQSTPAGTPVSTVVTATGVSLTPASAVDDMIIDAIGDYNTAISPNGGQTLLFHDQVSNYYGGASYKVAGSPTTTVSWPSDALIAYAAVALKQVSAGGVVAQIVNHLTQQGIM